METASQHIDEPDTLELAIDLDFYQSGKLLF